MTARRVAATLLAAMAFAAPAAIADVAGPDDSIQTAFGPMVPDTWYSGTFKSAGDVDYLALPVPRVPAAVHVDVTNLVDPCTSPDLTGCPVWATLIDAAAMQVGGEGSSAGTGRVDAGGSDVIDWVFRQAGTYYLAMDSAGDLPSYRVRHFLASPPPAGGGPAGPGDTPADDDRLPAATLSFARRQRGDAVRGRIAVQRALLRLTVTVRRSDGTTFASLKLSDVRAGRRSFTLRLAPAGRRALARHGRLRLTVRMIAVPRSGSRISVARPVTLVRAAAR